jgi:hypothetical protein
MPATHVTTGRPAPVRPGPYLTGPFAPVSAEVDVADLRSRANYFWLPTTSEGA